MNESKFYDVADRLNNGANILIQIGSGKYNGSIVKALDTKTHTTYKGQDYGYGSKVSDGYGTPGGQYEDHKIKFKINGRTQWISRYYLYEANRGSTEIIKTKALKDNNKEPPRDFLDREFNIDDVVFLYSPSYGEILGVINEINDKGTLTIRVAKKQHQSWSERSKQGIFLVPYDRANRILIIDDPAILLLRT